MRNDFHQAVARSEEDLQYSYDHVQETVKQMYLSRCVRHQTSILEAESFSLRILPSITENITNCSGKYHGLPPLIITGCSDKYHRFFH